MNEHPTLDRIVDQALGRLDESGEVADHLAGCERCREAAAWAAALAAATAVPPVAAPEAWIERAIAIPSEEPRGRREARAWSLARLLEDAFARPLLAGVRGAGTARRLLYAVAGGHVDLEIATAAEDGERLRITGQVLLDDADPPGDLAAILWRGSEPVARAAGDESGTFEFSAVPPGEYRLELLSLAAGAAIRIARVAVEAPSP